MPIKLLEKVNKEVTKLLNKKRIEKFLKFSYQYLGSSIVVIVKTAQKVKFALGLKALNKALHQNKYRLPKKVTIVISFGKKTVCLHQSLEFRILSINLSQLIN